MAVTTAGMKPGTTRSFGERVFEHHRKMGTAGGGELRARYAYGRKDYMLGGHPVWQLLRGVFQMAKRPYLLEGCFFSWDTFGCLAHGRKPSSIIGVDGLPSS